MGMTGGTLGMWRHSADLRMRALLLLSGGRFSAAALARKLAVSVITAKRIVAALRLQGHEIASVRLGGRAFYEVRDALTWEQVKRDPLLTTLVPAGRAHPSRGKPDDALYDEA